MPVSKTEKVYQNILDHIPGNAIFVYDKNLNLLAKGGEILNEFSSDKESNLYIFLKEGGYHHLLIRIEEVLLGETIFSEENINNKAYKLHLKPLFDTENKVYSLVLIFQDITNKQLILNLERKLNTLKTANLDLEQFAFIASHDLQEPLRKIKAFSERLSQSSDELPAETKSNVDKIANTVKRMQKLIDELLAYSEIGNDQKFETVSLAEVIADVTDELQYSLEEINAHIEVNVQHEIKGNNSQLKQLFRNLILNSIKYSKPDIQPFIQIKSDVCTACEAEPELSPFLKDIAYCKITLSDNGIGFDKKYSQDLFTLFYRLKQNKHVEGTGIGLAVCKKIAENHQGFITAKSEEGQGATFIIYLPK